MSECRQPTVRDNAGLAIKIGVTAELQRLIAPASGLQ
jgi:hypothetical protein